MTNVKSEINKELILLINEFIALRDIQKKVDDVAFEEDDKSREAQEKDLRKIWKKFRTGFFGSVERIERKEARESSKVDEAIKDEEKKLPDEEERKISNLRYNSHIYENLLARLNSRGGAIEKKLDEAMKEDDEKKRKKKLKEVHDLIQKSIEADEALQIELKHLVDSFKASEKHKKGSEELLRGVVTSKLNGIFLGHGVKYKGVAYYEVTSKTLSEVISGILWQLKEVHKWDFKYSTDDCLRISSRIKSSIRGIQDNAVKNLRSLQSRGAPAHLAVPVKDWENFIKAVCDSIVTKVIK